MPNPPTPNAATPRVFLQRAVMIAVPWTLIVLGWYGIAYSGLIKPGKLEEWRRAVGQ